MIFLQIRKTGNYDNQKSCLTSISENRKFSAVMEPAKSIIQKLGGEAVVSQITQTAYTAPYRWQHSRSKGGTDGLVPQRHHQKLLDYARANGIALEAAEFLAVVEAAE